MNKMTSSQFIWKRFFQNLYKLRNKNVKSFGTLNSLVDVQVNSTTGVATVSMQRPPVNGLNLDLVTDLINVMMQIEKDKGRGMILTSSAPGVFSAGIDLTELYKPNQDRLKAYWTSLQDMWLNLYSSRFPTAAAISGHSPAGGCLIALSCDYRVMVNGNFTIGLNETQLGLSVPSWFVDTFNNVIPKRQAELALVSGKLFKVDEALKIGLIDEIATDKKEAIDKAKEYIKSLEKFNIAAMSQTKLTLRYDAIKRLQDNREQDLRVFIKFVNSPEIQKSLEMYMASLKKK